MTRIDKLFRDFQQAVVYLRKEADLSIKHLREMRKAAYRVAASWLEMIKRDQNQLLALIASENKNMDEYLSDALAPFEAMAGETRRELFAAIEAGISEREFVAAGATVYLADLRPRSRQSGKGRKVATPVPDEPAESLPLREQNAQWKARAQAQAMEIGELKKAVHDLRRDLGEAQRIVARLKSQVVKLNTLLGLGAKAS